MRNTQLRSDKRRLNRQPQAPGGYTLIEILVVITIIVIVVSMTLAVVSFSREGDRVGNGARQVQSFFAGARDRAIYEKEPRGVRLFIEQNLGDSGAGSRTVTTMAYIAGGGSWSAPQDSSGIDLERIDNGDGDYDDETDYVQRVVGKNNPGWWNLKRRGLLVDGLRIRIPAGPSGNWYTIDTSLIDVTNPPPDIQVLLLQIPYADAGDPGKQVAHRDLTYEIELPPRLLPNQPSILPDRVVIDLDASKVPTSWRPSLSAADATGSGNTLYSGYMDVMFSPRGNVIGGAAAAGVMHFYVCDAEDSLYLKEQFAALPNVGVAKLNVGVRTVPIIPVDEIVPASLPVAWPATESNKPYLVKERNLVSLFTQTGAMGVYDVNAYVGTDQNVNPDRFDPYDIDGDSNTVEPDGLADDPYRFAETGEVKK